MSCNVKQTSTHCCVLVLNTSFVLLSPTPSTVVVSPINQFPLSVCVSLCALCPLVTFLSFARCYSHAVYNSSLSDDVSPLVACLLHSPCCPVSSPRVVRFTDVLLSSFSSVTC